LPAVPLDAADLSHQGTEAGTKTGLKCFWCISLAGFPAVGALAPVKDEVDDRHHDLGQLDVLMGMIGT
jgi:hypothetical protein